MTDKVFDFMKNHNTLVVILLFAFCIFSFKWILNASEVAVKEASVQERQENSAKFQHGWERLDVEEGVYDTFERMTIPEGTIYRSTREVERGVGVGLTFVPNDVADKAVPPCQDRSMFQKGH
jgi:hypothetical protein